MQTEQSLGGCSAEFKRQSGTWKQVPASQVGRNMKAHTVGFCLFLKRTIEGKIWDRVKMTVLEGWPLDQDSCHAGFDCLSKKKKKWEDRGKKGYTHTQRQNVACKYAHTHTQTHTHIHTNTHAHSCNPINIYNTCIRTLKMCYTTEIIFIHHTKKVLKFCFCNIMKYSWRCPTATNRTWFGCMMPSLIKGDQ